VEREEEFQREEFGRGKVSSERGMRRGQKEVRERYGEGAEGGMGRRRGLIKVDSS
jgi:hypothetical protein